MSKLASMACGDKGRGAHRNRQPSAGVATAEVSAMWMRFVIGAIVGCVRREGDLERGRVTRPGMDDEAREAAEVMTRYCAGESAAFHRLYALLAPRILAYLRGLIGEKATAEDLLQQTFLKVHEARSAYVRGANPIPWIYTIAHRTCLDEIRRRKRSRVRLTNDGTLAASRPPT